MFRFSIILLLLVIIPGPPLWAETDDDVFRSEIAGIELAKPDGWDFQNLEVIARHRASVKAKDPEFQEAIERLATAPLVVATKHPEPYESLNPSLQVLVRPLGQLQGSTGMELLQLVLPTLASNFEEFKLVEEISETEVGGILGARLTAEYVVKTSDGTVFPSRATIVLVPRESFLFQFSFSGPPSGPDALSDEVEAVLSSVTFL